MTQNLTGNRITVSEFSEIQKEKNFIPWLAMKHHRTHKNNDLDFVHHSYLLDIYYDNSLYLVVIKSTQCGLTEYLIVRCLGKAIRGMSIFYVLPTYDLVSRFVRNRLDKSINNTDYYESLEIAIREEKKLKKRSDSMTMMDIGDGTIAFVGSNSTAAFIEYPADEVIIDELDECNQDNVEMAWERLSHSDKRSQIKIANPTISGFGIDDEFASTDKRYWNIKCECGEYIILDWFKHVVEQQDEGVYVIRDKDWDWNAGRDIYPICDTCGRPVDRKAKGIWVPTERSQKHGYHISKLFAGTAPISEIVDRFSKGLTDPVAEKRFWNADLGQAFSPKGAILSEEMLNEAIGEYAFGMKSETGIPIIGIDVGNVLNVTIGYVMPDKTLKVVYIGEVGVEVGEVQKLVREYGIRFGVVDAQPEQHFVSKLKIKIKGMFACYYNEGKREPVDTYKNISVSRTASLDALKEAILLKGVVFPSNAKTIPKFYSQMTASVRTFDPDMNRGKGAYIWVHGSKADHYFHAMNYLLLARKLIVLYNK